MTDHNVTRTQRCYIILLHLSYVKYLDLFVETVLQLLLCNYHRSTVTQTFCNYVVMVLPRRSETLLQVSSMIIQLMYVGIVL